jgi:hypothetical protein
MMRKITAAFAGALVAGVLLGAAGRLMMRLVALAAGTPIEFTWSGSAGILLAYALFMLPGSLLAAFVRRRGRWLLLAVGAGVLMFPAVGIAGDEVGATGHFTALDWTLVSVSGLGVFVTIAVLPVVTLLLVDWLLSRLGVRRGMDADEAIRGTGAELGGGPLGPPAQTGSAS